MPVNYCAWLVLGGRLRQAGAEEAEEGKSNQERPGTERCLGIMKYAFKNTTSAPTIVIIEPWAEEFSVSPGSVLSIEISSAEVGSLETVINDKYFVVWLWGGCRAAVSLDGKDQARPALSIPAP